MFIEARLEFRNYDAPELEKGMLFMGITYDKLPVVYELKHHVSDKELFVSLNGYPVEPYIVSISNPNIPGDEVIFATPEEIGWWDEGDHSDELSDISLKQFNTILQEHGGILLIEMEDVETEYEDEEEIQPTLFQNKVTIRYANYIDDDEEDFT